VGTDVSIEEGGVAEHAGEEGGIAAEERVRADLYALLARLLRAPPSAEDLGWLSGLKGGSGDLGEAVSTLAAAARRTTPEAARDEYHDLFIGVGRGELVPYGSYYLTGFLHEKPLAKLRLDMGALGIARADNQPEPEDHIAALCEMMAGLIAGAFGEPADLPTQHRFFDTHIGSWAPRFFEDLEGAASAALYMPVGTIGKLFLRIEAQAFAMAA
jgi:TorA maturation chaperone TorD